MTDPRSQDDDVTEHEREQRLIRLGWLVGPAIVVVTVLAISGCTLAQGPAAPGDEVVQARINAASPATS